MTDIAKLKTCFEVKGARETDKILALEQNA
jgi:hypothetical protein